MNQNEMTIYANGVDLSTVYKEGDVADATILGDITQSKILAAFNNGPYGQWVNSKLYVNGTQDFIIDVAGSFYLSAFTENVCASNKLPDSMLGPVLTGNPRINGDIHTFPASSGMPANTVLTSPQNVFPSTPISVSQGDMLTVQILPADHTNNPCSPTYPQISYGSNPINACSNGTPWTESVGGQNRPDAGCWGMRGMGMGVMIGNGMDLNNINYDYFNQPSGNSNVYFSRNPRNNPQFTIIDSPYSGNIGFRIYNCSGSANSNCTYSQTYYITDILNGCISGSLLPACARNTLSPATFYQYNQGQYGFNISGMTCQSYGFGTSCAKITDPKVGKLQILITSANPNDKPINTALLSQAMDYAGTKHNGYYRQTIAANETKGNVWYRIYNTSDEYANSIGQLLVTTKIKTSPKITKNTPTVGSILNDILAFFLDPLRSELAAARMLVYNRMINLSFSKMGMALLSLYVVIYGVMFVTGLVEIKYNDLVMRLVKMGIILILISEDSWNFFSTYLFDLLEKGGIYISQLIFTTSGDAENLAGANASFEAVLFQFISNTFGMACSWQVWFGIATMMGSPLGALFATAMGWSLLTMITITIEVVVIYAMSLVMISLLIAVAPVFIGFSLFDRTKSYFNRWYQQIFHFALQPTILIASISFFFAVIQSFLMSALPTNICKYVLRNVDFGLFTIKFMDYTPAAMNLSLIVPSIFAFYYLIHILDHISQFASEVSGTLTTAETSNLPTYGKGGALGVVFGENSGGSLATDVRGVMDKNKEIRDFYNYKEINKPPESPLTTTKKPE
jgi:type IV secretory pathway VirB6-like protein